jgi:uncharacterized protein YaaW (UPF0174 family)
VRGEGGGKREFAEWIAEEYETYCDDSQKPKIRELARGWEKLFAEKKNLNANGANT